jgi:thiol-disulfide isomerase/thioredoxin
MPHRTLKFTLSVILLLVLFALSITGYYFFRVAPLIKAGKQEGIYLPASSRPTVERFGFEAGNGTRHSLTEFKGKVVVVDVWATWCGTCLYNIPNLIALHKKFQGRPLEVIGIDVDDEGWTKVKPFLQKHPEIDYPIAIPYPAASFQLKAIVDLNPLGNVSALPTVFVVDRQGRLAGKFIELGHEREIDELVSRLLSE